MTSVVHVSRLSDRELSRAFRCRALPFTALVHQPREAELIDAVRVHLQPELHAWLDDPPPSWRWIEAVRLERLLAAVERCTDESGIRALARRSVTRDYFAVFARVARVALRVGRVEHHWLARAFARALRRQVSGMDIRYESTGPVGRFTIRYIHLEHVRATSFAYWQGLIQGVFHWMGMELEMSTPTIAAGNGEGISGSFELRLLPPGARPAAEFPA